jgi:hypothetical protein
VEGEGDDEATEEDDDVLGKAELALEKKELEQAKEVARGMKRSREKPDRRELRLLSECTPGDQTASKHFFKNMAKRSKTTLEAQKYQKQQPKPSVFPWSSMRALLYSRSDSTQKKKKAVAQGRAAWIMGALTTFASSIAAAVTTRKRVQEEEEEEEQADTGATRHAEIGKTRAATTNAAAVSKAVQKETAKARGTATTRAAVKAGTLEKEQVAAAFELKKQWCTMKRKTHDGTVEAAAQKAAKRKRTEDRYERADKRERVNRYNRANVEKGRDNEENEKKRKEAAKKRKEVQESERKDAMTEEQKKEEFEQRFEKICQERDERTSRESDLGFFGYFPNLISMLFGQRKEQEKVHEHNTPDAP